MRPAELAVATFAAALAVAGLTTAHGVHDRRGTFTVESGRLLVAVEDAPQARAHALELLDELIVRDPTGRRLLGRLGAGTDLEYPVDDDATHVTLQLGRPRPGRRLSLIDRTGVGPASRPALVLSSGGNVATLRLHGTRVANLPCVPPLPDVGPLERVQVLVRLDDGDPRLEVILPLPLLETFLGLPRARAAAIDDAERSASRAAIARLVNAHCGVEGVPWAPDEGRVDFLDPTGAVAGDRPLNVASARVQVTLPLPSPARLEWRLFNAAVTTVDLVVTEPDGCRQRLLTPDRATLRLGPSPAPGAAGTSSSAPARGARHPG